MDREKIISWLQGLQEAANAIENVQDPVMIRTSTAFLLGYIKSAEYLTTLL